MGSTVSMQLYQNPNDIPYTKIEKRILRFLWKHKKPQTDYPILNKEQCCFKKIAGFTIPDFEFMI
jgi:hypothetical protein